MELARAIRALAKRPRLVAVGVLIAAAAALFSTYTLSGGKLRARSLQYSSASTQVIVDAERSVLGSVTQSFEPLSQRAWVYANFMTSPTFLDDVGKHVGLSGAQLYAAGPLTINEPRIEQEPTELKRNVEITGETKPYRLSYEAQTGAADDHDQLAGADDRSGRGARQLRRRRPARLRCALGVDGRHPAELAGRDSSARSGEWCRGRWRNQQGTGIFGVHRSVPAVVRARALRGQVPPGLARERHLGGGVGRRVERSGRQARDRRPRACSTRHLCAASREPSVRRHPGKRRRQCRRRGPSAENQVVSTLCAASKLERLSKRPRLF